MPTVTVGVDGGDATPPDRVPGRRMGRTLEERRLERRTAVLDAALDLFGTDGYPSTTVGQLCRAAGISTRSFYEEFENREAVLDQLYARSLEALIGAIDAPYRAASRAAEIDGTPIDPVEVARRQIDGFIDLLISDPRLTRIIFVELVGGGVDGERQRRASRRDFATYIAAEANGLAEAGLLPPGNYELLATGMVGALSELMIEWAHTPPADRPDRDALLATIYRLFLAFTHATGDPGSPPGR